MKAALKNLGLGALLRPAAPGDEAGRATRLARSAAGVAALIAIAAAGLDAVNRFVLAPELAPALFRQKIVMPVDRSRVRPREKLLEHLAEKSDVKVPPKTEKKPEVKPDPVKPEPKPESKPESKPVPRPEPKPEVKPVPQKAEPAPAPAPAVEAPVAPAPAPAPAAKPAAPAAKPAPAPVSAPSAGDRNRALGMIVQVIEANKRYPRRARQTGVEGTVTLSVKAGADGIVTSVEVSKKADSALLNRAALEAAGKLIGMKLPVTAPFTAEVPVVFTLQ